MNKSIVKIELIAEWIFLIIWMPFGVLATFCFLLNQHNIDSFISFVYITLNIITVLLQVGFFAYLIKNIINTKKYLKQLKEDSKQVSTIPTKHKRAFTIGIIEYILWLLILIGITAVFWGLSIFVEIVDDYIWIVTTYDTTFLIGNFIFLNSSYALIKLPQNKKLNILNIICLICSALAIITILARLLIVNVLT